MLFLPWVSGEEVKGCQTYHRREEGAEDAGEADSQKVLVGLRRISFLFFFF